MGWYQGPTGYGAMLPDSVYPGASQEPPPPQDFQYGLPPEVLAQIQGAQPANDAAPPDAAVGGGSIRGPALAAGLDRAQQISMGQSPSDKPIEFEPDYAGQGANPNGYQALPPEVLARVQGQAAPAQTAEQLPMPVVDAISGVDGGAIPAVRRDPTPPIGSAQDALAAMDQSGQAQQRGYQVAEDEADTTSGIKDKALAEAERQRAENAKAEAAHQAEMQRNYQQLSTAIDARNAMTIDPNRKWNNLGTGQKILAGIGVALSGVGQAIGGHGQDPNLGIKVIHDAIKDDVDDQLRQRDLATQGIEGQKQKIGAYDDLMKNDAGQRAALMADGLESAAQQIDAAAAKYTSPQLKAKAQDAAAQLRLAKNQYVAQGAAAQAGYNLKVAEVNQKALKEQQEADDKAQQRAETARHNKADEGLGWGRLSMEDKWKASEEADKKADKEGAREVGGVNPQPVKDDKGNVVGYKADVERNRDGTPVRFASDDEAKQARTVRSATMQFVHAVDSLRAIRGGAGWTSDTLKSKAWQDSKAEYTQSLLALQKSHGLSRLSEEDVKMLHGLEGDLDDPTRLLDILPGLERARLVSVRNLEDEYNSQPGNDVKLNIPDQVGAQEAKSTKEQLAHERLLKWQTNSYGYGQPIDNAMQYYPNLPHEQALDRARQDVHGFSDEQQQYVDTLAGKAKTDADSLTALRTIAETADSPGLREYAQSKMPAPTPAPTPTTTRPPTTKFK